MVPAKGFTLFSSIDTGLFGLNVPSAQGLLFTIPVPS